MFELMIFLLPVWWDMWSFSGSSTIRTLVGNPPVAQKAIWLNSKLSLEANLERRLKKLMPHVYFLWKNIYLPSILSKKHCQKRDKLLAWTSNYIVSLDHPFTKYHLLLHVCLHTTLDPIVSKGRTFSWKKIAGRSPKIAGESRTWNGCWILFRASTHQW